MISSNEINIKEFDESKRVENTIVVEKFNLPDNQHIIFSAIIQKNEGNYVLILTDAYDMYIDRYDQLTEASAPLI